MRFMVVSEWVHHGGNIHLSEQKDVIIIRGLGGGESMFLFEDT